MQASVVIPAYRASAFLPRAVRSVLGQTVRDWELLIVADDEIDYRQMLRAENLDDGRLRWVTTDRPGSGAGCARNAGLDAARGDVVVTLDADDTLNSAEALATILPLARAHGAAFSDVRIVCDESDAPLANLDRQLPRGLVGLEDILTSRVHTYAFVAFDRTRVGARWLNAGLGWEDVWFYAGCFDDLDGIYHLDEPLYVYRRRQGSTTTERGAAEYFARSAAILRAALEAGQSLGLRSASVRATMVRYLRGRERLEEVYLRQQHAGQWPEFLAFAAARRDQFYRLDPFLGETP